MSDQNVSSSGDNQEVQLWDPRRVLRRVSASDAALSLGFLRCRPEKWFPGFATHWMPVLHALGSDARISEIKTSLAKPTIGQFSAVGSMFGEHVVLSIDDEGARVLSEEIVPGGSDRSKGIVMEYLFRRLLASLALSWSGPQAAEVTVEHDVPPASVPIVGSVKIVFSMNSVSVSVWVGLGVKVVEILDGLWRRQVQSLSKLGGAPMSVRIELAQLGVPPQMLAEYLTKGTVIDLEVKASDNVTVKLGSKPWMPARLVDVGGMFGCEMTPGALVVPPVTEGATQLGVEFGMVNLAGPRVAELGQGGAIFVTEIPTSGAVNLVINEEKVGVARLCVFEGRFAIEVQ